MVILVVVPVVVAESCEVAQVRNNLRKALYEYFQSPAAATLALGKIKDLLDFYLQLPSGELTVDCSGLAPKSQVSYYLLVQEAGNVTTAIPFCADGTEFGVCSSTKPAYCYNGRLIQRCGVCGCTAGQACQTDGTCNVITTTQPPVQNQTTCTEGWTCRDASTRGYQGSDCNWKNVTVCSYGCLNGACQSATMPTTVQNQTTNQTTCSEGRKCWNASTALYQYANCTWDPYSPVQCAYGCVNGACKAAPYIQIVNQTLTKEGTLRITDDQVYKRFTNVHGNRIVWSGGEVPTDVYMYDRVTSVIKKASPDNDSKTQVSAAISGDRIAWMTNPDPADLKIDYDIEVYDISTGKTTPIAWGSGLQGYPDIDQEKIVWDDWDYTTFMYSIDLYDLQTGLKKRLRSRAAPIGSKPVALDPQISGDKVVWSQRGDIFMYDLTTGTEKQLTTSPVFQAGPRIDGDKIVWLEYASASEPNETIILYDTSTGQETRIMSHAGGLGPPDISGNRVVWFDHLNQSFAATNIFMYDIATGKASPIVRIPSYAISYVRIDGKVLTWIAGSYKTDVYSLVLA